MAPSGSCHRLAALGDQIKHTNVIPIAGSRQRKAAVSTRLCLDKLYRRTRPRLPKDYIGPDDRYATPHNLSSMLFAEVAGMSTSETASNRKTY